MCAAPDWRRSRRTRDGCSRCDGRQPAAGTSRSRRAAEARCLRRDEVRRLVSDGAVDSMGHARFHDLPRWLSPGDLLVVNTSGTLNAALPVEAQHGDSLELHVSTQLPVGFWTVEVRRVEAGASLPYIESRAGPRLRLPAGGQATLLAPYPFGDTLESPSRLWLAAVQLPCLLGTSIATAVRFDIIPRENRLAWPMYQTVFAEPAARAVTRSPVHPGRPARRAGQDRAIAPAQRREPRVMTTMGSSTFRTHGGACQPPDRTAMHRRPWDDRRSRAQSQITNGVARHLPARVGRASSSPGWPLRSVQGLISGFHEPEARAPDDARTAVRPRASRSGLREARRMGCLWHEFGDSHLILQNDLIKAQARANRQNESGTSPAAVETLTLVKAARPCRRATIEVARPPPRLKPGLVSADHRPGSDAWNRYAESTRHERMNHAFRL